MTTALLQALSGELLLMAAAVAIYLLGAFYAAENLWPRVAFGVIVLAALLLCVQGEGPAAALLSAQPHAAARLDALAFFGRFLALAAGGLLTLLTWRSSGVAGSAEYAGTLLLATTAAMLAVGANDLVLLFVGLELISIPTYILLYIGRVRADSQEAAVKYFFLSIFASAILLYGFSFLYGCAGSTDLTVIRSKIQAAALPNGFSQFASFAGVLILAGLGVKLAAAPFHFYAPDVYQGTTHANAALLSVLPKAAGVIVLMRLLEAASPSPQESIWRIVVCVAAVTMTWGNLLALWQDNLRRLLAYSSIANSGYILMGVAVGIASRSGESRWNGMAAALFYLAIYAAATLGAFAVFVYLSRGESPDCPVESIDDLAGVGRTRPVAAVLLAILFFSLTGVPPLAGFWGKLLIFGSSLNLGGRWFLTLAIVGALNAAVAAAYYLRIIGALYFRSPQAALSASTEREKPDRSSLAALAAAVICALAVVAAGVYPRLLTLPAERAAGQGQSTKYEVRNSEDGVRSTEQRVLNTDN